MIRNRSLLLLLLGGAALLGSACEGDGHMLSSGNSTVQLAAADVLIGERSVNGATIPAGSRTSTLFTVTLADPAQRSDLLRVQLDYSTRSSMGMMGDRLSMECYDDGTHGDAVAGDGTYSYMDMDGHTGRTTKRARRDPTSTRFAGRIDWGSTPTRSSAG